MNGALLVTGGCQCGAIRYRAALDIESAHLCHCRMCQKAAGNYFLPLASTRRSAFELTRGTITMFASSAYVDRGFCNQCGTPLSFEIKDADSLAITLGSLDQPELLMPTMQSGVESRMPWFQTLASIREMHSGEGETDGEGRIAQVLASNHQHPDHDT
jgi:hypothetical protein